MAKGEEGSEARESSSDQEMRNGSGKLLNTLTMTLSLVTASICGPGNCPLIRIPCAMVPTTDRDQYETGSKTTRRPRKTKAKESEKSDLLLDTHGPDVSIGDVPSEEPVRAIPKNTRSSNM